ncbi:MAG TPA: tetratricopeptide repeat protein [Xanthomonadales bacterium]|nr:tetratricopeptide repeat protein [Xanthomonadales bacterium]
MSQRKPSHKKPPARKAPAPAARAAGQRNLRNGLACTILVIFTLVAFANAWPNNLVFDDRIFADSTRFSGLGLRELLGFFTEDLWAASGEDSSLYRPLFLLLIAAQSLLFGEWVAGYHLVNIGMHVLATVLVYGFISRLLQLGGHPKGQARQFSLLAALVFGVHPIHTEAVNSVFNGSEILVTIGVVGGLSWFLDRLKKQPVKAWAGLNLVFLLVLLCRESGAALPLLVVAVLWLTRSDSWQRRLRACAPVVTMVLPLGIYLALRSHALGAPVTPGETPAGSLQPLASYGMDFGLAKLAPAVLFWFESLKNLVWPYPLQIYYDPPQTSAWLALAAQVLLLASAVMAWWRKQPLLLLGLAFFYLAILPSSRIIGEPGVQAALSDRVLYLPSVGFAIICALGLHWLARKTRFNAAVVTTLAVMTVMMPLTWARNAEWSSEISLFEADYRKLDIKNPIIGSMLAAHLRENNLARAVELCDENRQLVREGETMAAHCGSAYSQVGRFNDAEQAYLSVTSRSVRVFADFNLGLMYYQLGRKTEAEERIEKAIAAEPKPFMKHYFQAVALIQMHPRDRSRLLEARTLLQQALELQPQHIDSRLELAALNQKLNEAPPAR